MEGSRRQSVVLLVGFFLLISALGTEGRIKSKKPKAPPPQEPMPEPTTTATTTTTSTTTTTIRVTTRTPTTLGTTTGTTTETTTGSTTTTKKPKSSTPGPSPVECEATTARNGVKSDIIQYFATKTPYLPNEIDVEKERMTPSGCTAVEIWILGRHGTRYPGDKDIEDMQNRLPALRDSFGNYSYLATISRMELEAIQNWNPDPKLNISQESWLVDQGYDEWRGISKRFQQRFPQLFPSTFSSESYYFRGTVEQRTQESAKAFAGAIFGQSLPGVKLSSPIEGDPILHFYKTCDKWKKKISSMFAKIEPAKFQATPAFQQVMENVGMHLGIARNLTEEELVLMYKTCTFETAWQPSKQSPWCAVFNESDFEVMEYQEDLMAYWTDGYAYPITYIQACNPIKDVYNRFNAKVQNKNSSKTFQRLTTAYFGHSGTILKLYARLGLFKDSTPLTSKTFPQFGHNSRKWITSKMDKFASNIAFVLYKCANTSAASDCESTEGIESTTEATTKDDPVFKIGMLVQEQKTPFPLESFPACEGKWICPFTAFAQTVKSIVDTCNLDDICKDTESATNKLSSYFKK